LHISTAQRSFTDNRSLKQRFLELPKSVFSLGFLFFSLTAALYTCSKHHERQQWHIAQVWSPEAEQQEA
jgi:hypothetical protein